MAKVNAGIETSSWINIAAGVVVAVVAYMQTDSFDTPFYSGLVSGILLVAIGGYTAWAAANDRSRSVIAPAVATLLVGLWLAGYPWFASGVNDTYLYTMTAVGAIVAIVSIVEIVAATRAEKPTPRRPVA